MNTEIEKLEEERDSLYKLFFSSMEKMDQYASKGPSQSLLTIGMAMVTLVFFTKIKIGELSFFYLEPSEFIAFLLVAMVFMLSAAVIRVYEYRNKHNIEKQRMELGAKLLKENQETLRGFNTPNIVSEPERPL